MNYFKIRPYTKKELALMYFPDSEPHVAVNHLMLWIKRNPFLLKKLQKKGYKSTSKWLARQEVALIIKELGEP